jgi:hypothetical protein
VLLVLLALRQALRARRHHEAGLTPAAERGVDGGHHHVQVGDAAVGDPRLGAVEDPLVLGLVVDGPGLQRADVRAGIGLAHAVGTELELLGRAEALGHPLEHLLHGPGSGDAGGGEPGPEDGETDAGIPPEQLLEGDRQGQALRVLQGVGEEVEAVQPDLGGLLDDGIREFLGLVPLMGRGPDDFLGEVMDPFLDLELVLAEREGELGHGAPRNWVSDRRALSPSRQVTRG